MQLINKKISNDVFYDDIYYYFDNIVNAEDVKKIFDILRQQQYEFSSITLKFDLDNDITFSNESRYTDYDLFYRDIGDYIFEKIESISFNSKINSQIVNGKILLDSNVLWLSCPVKKNEMQSSIRR